MKLAITFALVATSLSSTWTYANGFAPEEASCGGAKILFDSNAKTKMTDFGLSTHKMIRGHIPRSVQNMSDLGKLEENKVIPVTFSLKLNHEDELDQRIAEMYREGSPTHHQFMTPNEFRTRYSPTAAQVEKERAYLEANGIAVESVSENRMLIRAKANAATLNSVLKTEIHKYAHKNGKVYFSPAYDLQIANESLISSVSGMNNVAKLHNYLKRQSRLHANMIPADAPGSAPGGGFSPADIRKAYNIPDSLDGAGQTLALFELDGYTESDITFYEDNFNLPHVPLQNVYLGGSTGEPGTAADEVTLDIQMMVAMAPKAAKIIVYEGPNTFQSMLDIFAKIANDNTSKTISTSWGSTESNFALADIQAESKVFKQMAAQGQTVFSSSGDSGADDNTLSRSIENPTSQPYVVSVGGTTLKVKSDGSWASESVWNDLAGDDPSGGGGGGVSTVWSIPTWQYGPQHPNRQSSGKMRNVPDVSLNADPLTGYGIYLNGQWEVIGGTSAAAPLWAAFNALVNQNRLAKGLSETGFLAPALYTIGGGKSASIGFHDITTGSNGLTDGFAATKGYDDASGLGTFTGEGLIDQLSAPILVPAPTPTPIPTPVKKPAPKRTPKK